MFRYALLFAAVAAAPAFAAPVPAPVPADQPAAPVIQPGVPGGFRVVDVKVDKDKLTWTETRTIPVAKNVTVTVEINGMKVDQTRTVTVFETVAYTVASELKSIKATDGAGKAIDAKKLAEMLKEPTPVVVVTGAIPEKHRKLFKDTTLFIEMPKPEPPKGGPVPFPAPPVVVPAPGGAPPVVLPPGAKSG
jgi:hypothetical protein